MKESMYGTFMECAKAFAKNSKAKKIKVGGVVVTPQDVILYSYNGTASGDDNECEEVVYVTWNECQFLDQEWIERTYPFVDQYGSRYKLVTKEEVLHSEANIIAKAAREGVSLKGATLFTTLSPCLDCSKLLVQAGIVRVVYDEMYRCTKGVDYLVGHGVEVIGYLEDQ